MTVLDDLYDRLSENPPRLPSWIFVPTTSIPPILDAIDYWIDKAKTSRTEKALALHEFPDHSLPAPGPAPLFPQLGNMGAYSDNLLREVTAAGLEAMGDEQLVQTGSVPDYVPSGQVRQYFQKNKSQIVGTMVEKLKSAFPTADNDIEMKWYMMTKTIPVPRELEARHVVLKQLLGAVRQGKETPRALITKVVPSRQCSVSEGSSPPSFTDTTGDRKNVETQHYAFRMFFLTSL